MIKRKLILFLQHENFSDLQYKLASNSLIHETTHPADNKTAKWFLSDLFKEDLLAPQYVVASQKQKKIRKQRELSAMQAKQERKYQLEERVAEEININII